MACCAAATAWAVLGKGLSPICNSMTSLPWPLSRLATARTSKAVSARRPAANWLNATGSAMEPPGSEADGHEKHEKAQKGGEKVFRSSPALLPLLWLFVFFVA